MKVQKKVWLIAVSALLAFSFCQSEKVQQETEMPKVTANVTYIKTPGLCPSLYLVEFEGKRFLMQHEGGLVELKD